MRKLNDVLRILGIKPRKYEQSGKAYLVESHDGKYVIKKNDNPIYDYLKSRSFEYYPATKLNEGYEITSYEEEVDIHINQKILDLVSLVALLHLKTTYYKPINEYDYTDIYDDIKGNVTHLKEYYHSLMDAIEKETYMSPSSYLLARHITQILNALIYCEQSVEEWREKVKGKTKIRLVTIHNNLSLDHFINGKLISWNKAKNGSPIIDIYKLYKRTYLYLVWDEVIKKYTSHYPLHEEEIDLFCLLISIPEKIEFTDSEYANVKTVNKLLEYLDITGNLIERMKKTSR